MECSKCGGKETRKVGQIITVKEGKKQRYQCKTCGRSFYPSSPIKEDETK